MKAHKPKEITINNFPFLGVDPFQKAPFCVDGRAGKANGEVYGPYPQNAWGKLNAGSF